MLYHFIRVCFIGVLLFSGLHSAHANLSHHPHTPAPPKQVLDKVWFYFVDQSGDAAPSQVTDIKALIELYGFRQNTAGQNNFGYDRSVFWILLPMEERESEENNYLELNYPLLDDIQLYAYNNHQWHLQYHTGDKQPFHSRPVDHRLYYFPLENDVTHYLLRIQTDGAANILLSFISEAAILKSTTFDHLIYGLFLGALGIMCFYNLFVFSFTRERPYLFYVITLSFILLYQLGMTGFGYQFLWQENGEWVNEHLQPISVGLMIGFMVLFTREVLNLRIHQPLQYRVFGWESKIAFSLGFAGFFLPLHSLIHIAATIPILVLTHIIISGFMALRARVPGAPLFIAGWGAGLLGAICFALQQLGLLPASPWFDHSLKVGIIINVVFLSFVLVSHINVLKAQKQSAQDEANKNRRIALHDALTGVPNRRAFDQHFGKEYRRARREKERLSLLMIDVDHFKLYNDTYGHSGGDDALTRVAMILRSCLSRPTDSLFRYGGEEFAVVLADTDLEGAIHIADRLISTIRENNMPHKGSPLGKLTVSIGIASDNDYSEGPFHLLERADQALYAAKTAGRNRYQVEIPQVVMLQTSHQDKR